MSFNPYFTGSNSGSSIYKIDVRSCLRVSILILLEVILEVRNGVYNEKEVNSFNPYFTGSNSGSSIYKIDVRSCLRVSILILLEVILEEYSAISSLSSSLSFNPYFTGSNSGSPPLPFQAFYTPLFQSLFYWK